MGNNGPTGCGGAATAPTWSACPPLHRRSSIQRARPALHIAGVREMNGDLFRMLDAAADRSKPATVFTAYMATTFGLEPRTLPSADAPPA